MIALYSFGMFLAVFFFVIALAQSFNPGERQIAARIKKHVQGAGPDQDSKIVLERRNHLSAVPVFNRLLEQVRRVREFQTWVRQSGLTVSTGALVLICVFIGVTLFLMCRYFSAGMFQTIIITALSAFAPLGYVSFKRKSRMKAFSKLFPDAIGKLSSSLRAGYSFPMALESVVHDSDTLVSSEFKQVLAEMELGQGFEKSLQKILDRIDTPDLRLFIASVSIQRESGGNLTEILDNLEGTIRERFQLQQELEAASGQGKLSGIVLAGLPVFVGVAVFVINQDYIRFFFDDPVGKNLFWASLGGQLMGIFVIKKIVTIEM